jgi:hypothetical protein
VYFIFEIQNSIIGIYWRLLDNTDSVNSNLTVGPARGFGAWSGKGMAVGLRAMVPRRQIVDQIQIRQTPPRTRPIHDGGLGSAKSGSQTGIGQVSWKSEK